MADLIKCQLARKLSLPLFSRNSRIESYEEDGGMHIKIEDNSTLADLFYTGTTLEGRITSKKDSKIDVNVCEQFYTFFGELVIEGYVEGKVNEKNIFCYYTNDLEGYLSSLENLFLLREDYLDLLKKEIGRRKQTTPNFKGNAKFLEAILSGEAEEIYPNFKENYRKQIERKLPAYLRDLVVDYVECSRDNPKNLIEFVKNLRKEYLQQRISATGHYFEYLDLISKKKEIDKRLSTYQKEKETRESEIRELEEEKEKIDIKLKNLMSLKRPALSIIEISDGFDGEKYAQTTLTIIFPEEKLENKTSFYVSNSSKGLKNYITFFTNQR